MARTARTQPVVEDEFGDTEFDDAELVEDVTPVQEVQEVEDLGVVEEPVAPPPVAPSELATTNNFFGAPTQDGIEDLGVITVTPDEEETTYQVAVTEDIGPVFYGYKSIEMKKGRLYRVTTDVYQYLYERGKLVGQ